MSRVTLLITSILPILSVTSNEFTLAFCSPNTTSAKFFGGRDPAPAKITSSIPPLLMELGLFSPITHLKASNKLDFPQPLGPTMPVRPGRISISTGSTKLLNPRSRNFENSNSSTFVVYV